MKSPHDGSASAPQFKRMTITVGQPELKRRPLQPLVPNAQKKLEVRRSGGACSVLVINSSQEMAKEITMQLTLKIPGCGIMYAPTIHLAQWILSRRQIDLIVSSPLLPDGNVSRLKAQLGAMSEPPDLVVVGELNTKNTEILNESVYEFATMRMLGEEEKTDAAASAAPPLNIKISSLGADLRNDLNNPLQEIVAMVFVAKSAGMLNPATEQALAAIDTAAKNMATVVKELEEKIRTAVSY